MRTVETFGRPDTGNIVIEADNLDALKMLQGEYAGKIDVITIDPPYNTDISYIGYKDSGYSEGWGTFIADRLLLARSLLSPTGAMFINIDENELVSLLNICYYLFGVKNVNVLIWPKVDPPFDKNRVEKPVVNIRSTHEYIVLCYMDKASTHFGNTIDGKPMESIVAGYGTTSSAKDEICELLGDRSCFSTPKPVALIRELIRVASAKDSVILDFFAGSGTAGHATMALNADDGGRRRFILITNNESDICRKVTVPRLKSAIEREGYDSGFAFMTMLERKAALIRSKSDRHIDANRYRLRLHLGFPRVLGRLLGAEARIGIGGMRPGLGEPDAQEVPLRALEQGVALRAQDGAEGCRHPYGMGRQEVLQRFDSGIVPVC